MVAESGKGFSALMGSKRCFFENKRKPAANPKTSGCWCMGADAATAHALKFKSFFASFCSQKEALS
jgi:hypothetical protein